MSHDDDRVLVSRATMELAMGGLLLGIACILLVGSIGHGIGWGLGGPLPGLVPFMASSVLALSSLGIIVQSLRARRSLSVPFLRRLEGRRVASLLLPLLAYLVAVYFLGLYLSTVVYIGGVMRLQGRYSWLKSAGVSLGIVVALYVIFEIWFQIPLLKGPIEGWLGLD